MAVMMVLVVVQLLAIIVCDVSYDDDRDGVVKMLYMSARVEMKNQSYRATWHVIGRPDFPARLARLASRRLRRSGKWAFGESRCVCVYGCLCSLLCNCLSLCGYMCSVHSPDGGIHKLY